MVTRRGNNEGSVRKRPDGRWEARVSISGRQRSIYGKTRDEVSRKLRAAQQSVDKGLNLPGERLTVGQYLDQWLEVAVRPAVRPGTYDSYAGHVKHHLTPALGKRSMVSLQPQHVQAMMNQLVKERGLSPNTVLRIRATLRRALNQAMKWDIVGRNVATLVNPPKGERFRVEPLTPDEAIAIIEAVKGHRLEALFTLLLGGGLRVGEALGLRWEDIDLDANRLKVRFALRRVDGKHQLVAPKSASSRRTVTLPQFAVKALRIHREKQDVERPPWSSPTELPLVFVSTTGRPLDGPGVHHAFQKVMSAAGLRPLRLHDLRHGYATLLLVQGVQARVVMELLGHSQITLTLDTYSHVVPQLQQEAVDRLDELFPVSIQQFISKSSEESRD